MFSADRQARRGNTHPGLAARAGSRSRCSSTTRIPRTHSGNSLRGSSARGSSLPYTQRVEVLTANRIALWDVLAAAERPGSLDSSIVHASALANDFAAFYRAHPQIRRVYFNGRKAEELYRPIRAARVVSRIRRAALCVHAFNQPRPRGHDLCREVREMENDQGESPMNFADKACPVVFRDSSLQQILAFEHPKAGLQLVKGRIEPGENARAAALRELRRRPESPIWPSPATSAPGIRAQRPHLVAAAVHLQDPDCPRPGPTIAPTTAATNSGSSGTT